MEVIRTRSGTHFDPAVVGAAQRDPEALFAGIDRDTVEEVLEAEPIARAPLTDDELDRSLEAIGDFCDLRSPYFAGHASGTAELAVTAAELMNLTAAETSMLRRAALIHDVGRFGVPGSVWDKPGPLIGGDLERMRMHVYYVERIFNRPEPLRKVGRLAATHHERTDGSGYHRGVAGAMLSPPARVLAAADAYHAMTQRRPHRGSMTEADAARHLRADADAGRLDPAATEAVLSAAGHAILHQRTGVQAGLTAREREVLRLLTEGLPNKAIARSLGISPKTVSNHVEHVYAKLAVSNRAAAAMSAMQLGLMSTLPQHSSNR
jgi:HD-GYP domain-containing protein (c-di-GMP phosphodiesterase class II)